MNPIFAAFTTLLIGALLLRAVNNRAFTVWIGLGARELVAKRTIVGFIFAELALLLGGSIPYLIYGEKGSFAEYVAFASPAVAALVVGGGILYDGKKKLDSNGWAFFGSSVFVLIGWIAFLDTKSLDGRVWLWAILIAVASFTAGLLALSIEKDYSRDPLDGLFGPVIIALGGTTVLVGSIFYLTDKVIGAA